jgi:hypothetical protein
MKIEIKAQISKEQARNLHQLHGDSVTSFSTVEEEDGVVIIAETTLSEDSLLKLVEGFKPQKDRRKTLEEKVKVGNATNEERFELYDKLLGLK